MAQRLTSRATGFLRKVFGREQEVKRDLGPKRPYFDPSGRDFNLLSLYGYDVVGDYLRLDHDLFTRFYDYEEMDDYPDLSAALDIYADDATQVDSERRKTVWIESDDEHIRKSGEEMLKRVRAEEQSWEIARSLCKYGNNYEELLVNDDGVHGVAFMPPATVRRIEGVAGELMGFVQSYAGDFTIDPSQFGDLLANESMQSGGESAVAFEGWRCLHMRLRGKYRAAMYGHSIFDPARWIWKRLMLLEDATLIYKLTRSPSRFAFYVDTGRLQGDEALAFVNRVAQMFKKRKFVNPKTGRLDMQYNPLGYDEDFFLPVMEGGRGTKVELLEGPTYQCLAGDVRVPLLNGDRVSMQELAEKYADKEFWVYSMSRDGRVVPGKAYAPRATGKKQVWKVKLDNGHVVRASDNHPWLKRDGTYARTDMLKAGDRLMPWCTALRSREHGLYEKVYQPESGTWEYTHRMVMEAGGVVADGMVVHHRDEVTTNNDPENLELKTRSEHTSEHSKAAWKSGILSRIDAASRLRDVNASREMTERRLRGLRAAASNEGAYESRRGTGNGNANKSASLEELRKLCVESGEDLKGIRDVIRVTGYSQNLIVRLLSEVGIDWCDFAAVTLPGWKMRGRAVKTMREKVTYENHVVVSVECTEEVVEMYDLTVDEHHNFAIEDGVFVHNSMEDVEYFLKKLYAAIKVPRAYLGYDENMPSKATLSQEDVRFARTVMRIQREVRNGYGRMFEIDLAARGIDPSRVQFDVAMTIPSHIFEEGQMGIRQARAQLADAMRSHVSEYWVLQNVFGLSDDEISVVIKQRRSEQIEDAKYEGEAERARRLGEEGQPTVGMSSVGEPLPQIDLIGDEMGEPQEDRTRVGGLLPKGWRTESRGILTMPRIMRKGVAATRRMRGAGGISERELLEGNPRHERGAKAELERVMRSDPALVKRLDQMGKMLKDLAAESRKSRRHQQ